MDIKKIEQRLNELKMKISPEDKLIHSLLSEKETIIEFAKSTRRKHMPWNEKLTDMRLFTSILAKEKKLIENELVERKVKNNKTVLSPAIDNQTLKRLFDSMGKSSLINPPKKKK